MRPNPHMYPPYSPNFRPDYMMGQMKPPSNIDNRAASSSIDRQKPSNSNINPRFPNQSYNPYPPNYYDYRMQNQYGRMQPYPYPQFPANSPMNSRMGNKTPEEMQKQYMGQMGNPNDQNKQGNYQMPYGNPWYNQYMMSSVMRNRQDQSGYDRSPGLPPMKSPPLPDTYNMQQQKMDKNQVPSARPPNPQFYMGYSQMDNRYMGCPPSQYGGPDRRQSPNPEQPPYSPKNWDKNNTKK